MPSVLFSNVRRGRWKLGIKGQQQQQLNLEGKFMSLLTSWMRKVQATLLVWCHTVFWCRSPRPFCLPSFCLSFPCCLLISHSGDECIFTGRCLYFMVDDHCFVFPRSLHHLISNQLLNTFNSPKHFPCRLRWNSVLLALICVLVSSLDAYGEFMQNFHEIFYRCSSKGDIDALHVRCLRMFFCRLQNIVTGKRSADPVQTMENMKDFQIWR